MKHILSILKKSQQKFLHDGVEIVGIFGSYAKGKQKASSDIDIAYRLIDDKFFSKHKGFEAVSKISDIKEELSLKLKKKVDFISFDNSNKELVNNIKKDIIYV